MGPLVPVRRRPRPGDGRVVGGRPSVPDSKTPAMPTRRVEAADGPLIATAGFVYDDSAGNWTAARPAGLRPATAS